MNTMIKPTLCFLFMIIVMTLKAQMPEYKLIIRDDSVVSAHIQDKEISTILDRVFPNVEYEFHYVNDIIPSSRILLLRYDNKVCSLDQINSILLAIKYSEDTVIGFSNEDLIKSFVYLSLFGVAPDPYLKHVFDIEISQIDLMFEGEIPDEYKRIGFDEMHLNYHCTATWVDLMEPELLTKWDIYFNIEGNEFISMVGTKIYRNEIDRRFNFFYVFEYSAVRERYQPTGREYEVRNLQEEKSKRKKE